MTKRHSGLAGAKKELAALGAAVPVPPVQVAVPLPKAKGKVPAGLAAYLGSKKK